MNMDDDCNAEVISVFPDKVKVSVSKLDEWTKGHAFLKVGSYLWISDHQDCALIAVVENFAIEVNDRAQRRHVIEALPLGVVKDGKFSRGGDCLTIPPTGVRPASDGEIKRIFTESVPVEKRLVFSSLLGNRDIEVPVDGNKFFNKHVAVVGSTGAGKSHTVAKIIQAAISEKDGGFPVNNSHVVLFDIHSEYKEAFPGANFIGVDKLNIPYWLLNSDELEEILLDTGERDNYNQSAVFRLLVTENKRRHNPLLHSVFYDSPVRFDIEEVLNALYNIRTETINYRDSNRFMINDGTYVLENGKTEVADGILLSPEERISLYFERRLKFHPVKSQNISKGDYADGSLDKFFSRFESKIRQKRLEFLFGGMSAGMSLDDVLKKIIGYCPNFNVTVIDLSGVPFEVLSITVSVISRLIFEYGYRYKVYRGSKGEKANSDAPFLLVYEEAHKYAPNNDLAKFRAAKNSIERIAKEGRKYGVTLLLASQRPSEISETIFSQCNNFIAMRLTNPADQSYVSKLLPDAVGNLINKMPTLGAGEALLIGDSVIMPSLVKIKPCQPPPSSNDIPYWELWKQEWKEIDFDGLRKR